MSQRAISLYGSSPPRVAEEGWVLYRTPGWYKKKKKKKGGETQGLQLQVWERGSEEERRPLGTEEGIGQDGPKEEEEGRLGWEPEQSSEELGA